MRISPISITKNNQTQNNESTNKISSSLTSTPKNNFSPSFGRGKFFLNNTWVSDTVIDSLNHTELFEFAKTIHNCDSSDIRRVCKSDYGIELLFRYILMSGKQKEAYLQRYYRIMEAVTEVKNHISALKEKLAKLEKYHSHSKASEIETIKKELEHLEKEGSHGISAEWAGRGTCY